MSRRRSLLVWLPACMLLLFGSTAASAQTAAPVVRIQSGILRGVAGDGVERFNGVPYAAAPVGPLRWARPRAPTRWRGVRDASAHGNRCPQTATGNTPRSETEDCLFLDVVRPEKASGAGRRAVLVYVHGGGATNGAAADHDGAELAQVGDIIVVTVNYRLGALGFMSHPAIAAESGSGAGNYGVMDVALALRWVARNIASFGGDPGKVTLAGESAGGTVICPIIVADGPRFFRAAILSSDDCQHDVDDLRTTTARALALSHRLGCDTAANPVACLRGRSVAEILDAGGFAAPHVGGQDAPGERAFDAIQAGRWRPIPILVGANADEGRIAGLAYRRYDGEAYAAWLRRLVGEEAAARIAAAYPIPTDTGPFASAYTISQVLTDSGMRGYGGCASLALARNMARAAPVYFYQFEDPNSPMGPAPEGWRFGAAHGAELAYLWPGGGFSRLSHRFDPPQGVLSQEMIRRWAAFVRTLSPNADGLSTWTPLAQDNAYMALEPAQGGHMRSVAAFAAAHRCALWFGMPWIMDRGEA